MLRARPPLLFTAAYGAGLATGLLRFNDPLIVLGIIGAAAALRARPFTTLLAAALILGSTSAEIAWLHESVSCTSTLPSGRIQLLVRLVDPADPQGGRLDLQPLRAGCHGTVVGRWPAGQTGMAGTVFNVAAKWVPRAGVAGRPSGTLVVTRAERVATEATLGERVRGSLTQTSKSLYGARAPLVDALILGRRGGIDRTLQDRFAQSGLVHLLSISGFHVGVITAWIFLLCRLFRGSRTRALAIAAAVSVIYVAFLGWPAPATRASALAVLVAISRIRQRRVEANALLSATCLCVLLVDPWAVMDLGGWLSVAALWGATTFTRWTDRALGPSVGWRTLGSSLGATLATAPITAAALGTVAPVGILLNFGAIPLAAVTVPGVFASLLLFPLWPMLGHSLAGGAGLGLHLLEILATLGSGLPGGHIIAAAGLRSAVPWISVFLLSLWAIGPLNTLPEAVRRWSWSAVASIWVGLLWSSAPASADSHSKLALHFLDVGQGDGAVLRTPEGRWVLIDAGPKTDRSDAGRRVVVPFLLRAGARRLSIVFVSHAHADHLGGVPSVLDRFSTQAVIEPGEPVPDPLYYGFLDGLASEAIPWYAGRLGQRFILDSVSFTILHPDRQWSGWGEDVNEDSLVLLIQYREFEVLFAGDAGFPAERAMRNRIRPVDLLKVGHHGSRGSSGDEWLNSLRPQVAVISVGQNNYGHPAPETLARLKHRRVEVWRTDQDGSVTVTTDGRTMSIRSRGREMTYDVQDNSVNSKP